MRLELFAHFIGIVTTMQKDILLDLLLTPILDPLLDPFLTLLVPLIEFLLDPLYIYFRANYLQYKIKLKKIYRISGKSFIK